MNLNDIYNKIINKRVFIFDLETTGLFDMKNHYKYWCNSVFDSSRIIEIGYYYTDNFIIGLNEKNDIIIHNYLRKPTDFKNDILEDSIKIHGITYDKLITNGYKFSNILNQDLLEKLNNCDYIISHNTLFDFSILLNELNRFKLKNTINNLLQIKKSGNLLCTCRATGFKKLKDVYKNIFNEFPDIQHRAGDDVKTLIEILIKKKVDYIQKIILSS